jgi:hypothetical protein
MLATPTNVTGKFAPLAVLLESVLVKPKELAERWGYSDQTLSNQRANNRGLPFVTLPGGAIRYRASEIIACEHNGTRGPLSVERVAVALAEMPDVPERLQVAIIARLKELEGLR